MRLRERDGEREILFGLLRRVKMTSDNDNNHNISDDVDHNNNTGECI